MASAQTLINASLRTLGVLASGETATAEESSDALDTLNRMMESWRLERLSAYALVNQSVAWAANLSSKTMGTGGDWNIVRPVKIESANWLDSAGTVFPLESATQEAFATLDSLVGTPMQYCYESTYPLATLRLWPTPDAAGTAVCVVRVPFSALVLGDTISLPPGYERAMVFNLAVELAAQYGIEPPPSVVAMAKDAKADIKRNNMAVPLLNVDFGQRTGSDIVSGDYV